MRIVYGVHGYGRGHATRAWAVLPSLCSRHEVRIFGGADAYEVLSGAFEVEDVPALSFVYRNGRRSNGLTLQRNLPLFRDLVWTGPSLRSVAAKLQEFEPDVVISDCEPWTYRAAGLLGIPRITFDHFGVMVHCEAKLPWVDRLKSALDRTVYGFLMAKPNRALVSSFYTAPPRRPDVRVIGTLLREEVHKVKRRDGDHVLAYFNQGAFQLTKSVQSALEQCGREVRLYGGRVDANAKSIVRRPFSDRGFLEDLASCRAIVSTAGNQLVGEAMAFEKPILALPESSVEQRMNAAAIEALGIGERSSPDRLTAMLIRAFLDRAPSYAERMRAEARDARAEAVETLETWIAELGPRTRRTAALCEAAA